MPYTSVHALERSLVHTSMFLHTCPRFPLPALSLLLMQCSSTGIIIPSTVWDCIAEVDELLTSDKSGITPHSLAQGNFLRWKPLPTDFYAKSVSHHTFSVIEKVLASSAAGRPVLSEYFAILPVLRCERTSKGVGSSRKRKERKIVMSVDFFLRHCSSSY